MRRFRFGYLTFAAVVGMATAAFAAGGEASDATPSLEYRPPRQVVPEPKAPRPLPPKTVFAEAIGSFGIMTGSFDQPVDVARDSRGNFYVLDAGNNRVQVFGSSGRFAGSWGSSGSREGQFNRPSAIVVGPFKGLDEAVYVVDTGNDRIQVFNPAPILYAPAEKQAKLVAPIKVFGSRGSWKGDFNSPRDIAIAKSTAFEKDWKIYVLDSGNERVQRFEIDGEKESGTTFELRGGRYTDLTSLVWSEERLGYLYVLGPGCLVQQFSLGGGAEGNLVNTFSGIAPESGLCVPSRIRIDEKNHYLYILDVGNSLLICFNPSAGGMYRWALRGAELPFFKPQGLSVNPDGDEFLVADTENNTVQKFTLR